MNKLCPKCGKTKPISEFHKNKGRKDGLNGWCKDCMSLVLKDRYIEKKELILTQCRSYRVNNPEKRHEICKNYKLTHRDGVRTAERRRYHADLVKSHLKKLVKRHRERVNSTSSFTIDEWNALCKSFNHYCVACKEKKPLTVDHIIPISAGGSNLIENIQPLCKSCNSRKGNQVIDYRS